MSNAAGINGIRRKFHQSPCNVPDIAHGLRRIPLWGWGCSSVGRASDRHAADAGSIPRCGKRFFSQSQLSVQILLRCPCSPPHPLPCAIACIYTCADVKNPVVHVRVRLLLKNCTSSMHRRQNFLREKFHWNNTVEKIYISKKKVKS